MTAATTEFESLIALLGQEQGIYEELAALLDAEREALLAMAVERVGEIATRKETLALRIKALDESRKVLAQRLGAECRLAADQVTLTALCAAAPAPLAGRLRRAGDSLRATVERCQSLNQYNARAARRGLELVSGAVAQLIDQADPAGQLYQPPQAKAYGAPGRGRGAALISRQA